MRRARERTCGRESVRSHTHVHTIRRCDSAANGGGCTLRETRQIERVSERKRERVEKRQTLSREQHDVRRGCRQHATATSERNDDDDDDGYTRAAPPTLNDVIPPAATWSPPTYARTTRDTNTTTRTTHDDYDDSRSLATASRRAVLVFAA